MIKCVALTSVLYLAGTSALAEPLCVSGVGGASHMAAQDVAYQKGPKSQKLDIYVPTEALAPYKTVILIHGGCFQYGDKHASDDTDFINRLTGYGYAVVSLNYRLADPSNQDASKKNLFPASLEDVQDATRWVRSHGLKYGLLTEHLVAMGYSAGATLSAYLGTRPILGSDLREDGKPNDPLLSKKVSGVVDFFGRMDFSKSYPYENHDSLGRDCGEEYLGESRGPNDIKDFERASVLNAIDSTPASFAILHGTQDKLVSVEHSEELYNKLVEKASGTVAEKKERFHLFKMDGADHMFEKPGEMDKAWMHVCPFLVSVLGNPTLVHATKMSGTPPPSP